MQIANFSYDLRQGTWTTPVAVPALDSPRTLVLAFGAPAVIDDPSPVVQLARAYPKSIVVGCSTAGEVHGATVRDDTLVATVTRFEKTELGFASMEVAGPEASLTAGQALARKLLAARAGLRAVLVLSEGLNVNGSELVRGLCGALDASVVVTGGLSGDGTAFGRTWVSVGSRVRSNVVAAVGFYGDHIVVGHGSKGGWDKFGPERVVTRAAGNVLYELDGKPALALYKEYLGDRAKDLPASGLLFPLSLRRHAKDDKVLVRTLLAVDHAKESMTFAGDVPQGSLVQLMKADFDRLIDGAADAAAMARETGAQAGDDALVVAISCVGRRLVLGDRTEEEVEAVLQAMPSDKRSHLTGFYSYGEISPFAAGSSDLHNQTMTLTVFSESDVPVARARGREARPTPPAPGPRPKVVPLATATAGTVELPTIDLEIDTSEIAPLPPPPASGFTVRAFDYLRDEARWSVGAFPALDSPRTLVLAFGASAFLEDEKALAQLADAYPRSVVLGCSTAGEVHGTVVRDDSLSVTVTRFEKTDLGVASLEVGGPEDSYAAGQNLARKLLSERAGLRGVLVLSEGLAVNGSELVRGLSSVLDETIVVTGGLSGDGTSFAKTWVSVGARPRSNVVAAVGFYGDHVVIGHASKGGWDKFGPERVVTRSEGNVLYELDGKPALALYKEYLGDKARDLPASGLLFPLSLRASAKDEKVLVRTILAVDHEKSSLTFAGDIPRGHLAQLMKADFERLIGGASMAGALSAETDAADASAEALVVAISCVGRRLVLGDRTEEEVEAVRDALPTTLRPQITGFYSYGEISPYAKGHCDLHNQTMTLTTFRESRLPLPRPRATTKALPSSSAPPREPPRAPTPPLQRELMPRPRASTPPPASQPNGPSAPVVTRAQPNVSGASGASFDQRVVGGITVLAIRGRISESFKGEPLGQGLSGVVVVDLAEVERVTSYGVREWLGMLAAARNVERWVLARCSEAVVNQLSMIRKFAGDGLIASFFAPYLCARCGNAFERLFDTERDGDAIVKGAPPACPCPRCEGEGRFDDDASTYFAFATSHVGAPLPDDLRGIANDLDQQPSTLRKEAVDKLIDGDVTRLRVQTRLSAELRWPRLLEGVEGRLVVDLAGCATTDAPGIAALLQALNALGPEVQTIELERCPQAVVEAVVRASTPVRATVRSAVLDAHCASCNVPRPALVSTDEHGEAVRAGGEPAVACKRCGGPLTLRAPALLRAWLVGVARTSRVPPAEVAQAAVSHHAEAAGAPHALAPRRRMLPVTALVATGLLATTGAIVATLVLRARAHTLEASVAQAPASAAAMAPGLEGPLGASTAAKTPAAAPSGWTNTTDLPPAWAERPYAIEGENLYLVGKGDVAESAESSLQHARNEAIVRLLRHVAQDLSGSLVYDYLQPRLRDDDRGQNATIAARYLRQVGAFATPERVEVTNRQRESGVEVYARYRLARAVVAQVVATYRATATVQGLVLARVFPLLELSVHTDAELVVVSVQRATPGAASGARPGDFVLGASGRPATSPEAFAKAALDEWAMLPAHNAITLEMEVAGARKSARIFKPGPTN